jgi:ribosomal protein S18 acetylase RimI-like enzyme
VTVLEGAVEVREVDRLDGRTLAELIDVLVAVVDEGASIGFLPPLDRGEAETYWVGVSRPETVLLVAGRDGRIDGTIQLHLESRPNGRHRAEVAKLMVHPGARRRGLGRILMERLEGIAGREGRTLLVLDTREGDPSNDLYRSMGYVEAGRIPSYAQSATGQLAATVFYYKDLT